MSLIWHQSNGGLGPVEAQCPNGGRCWSIEAGVGEWVEAKRRGDWNEECVEGGHGRGLSCFYMWDAILENVMKGWMPWYGVMLNVIEHCI